MPQSSVFGLPSSVNSFAFKIATVNGTGSASANSLLMQSIFRMGIPVSGKNIFPSNIQGLPTWYEIRVSKDGYTARPPEIDLIVALNTGTYEKDIATVRPGGCLLYDSSWPLEESLLRDESGTVICSRSSRPIRRTTWQTFSRTAGSCADTGQPRRSASSQVSSWMTFLITGN